MTRSSETRPQPAVIQVASGSSETRTSVACTFKEMQGKRMHLEADRKLTISTPVSVECNDAMFLGEVIACSPVAGSWHVEIKVKQILTGLQSLVALRSRLLGEGISSPLAVAPAELQGAGYR